MFIIRDCLASTLCSQTPPPFTRHTDNLYAVLSGQHQQTFSATKLVSTHPTCWAEHDTQTERPQPEVDAYTQTDPLKSPRAIQTLSCREHQNLGALLEPKGRVKCHGCKCAQTHYVKGSVGSIPSGNLRRPLMPRLSSHTGRVITLPKILGS